MYQKKTDKKLSFHAKLDMQRVDNFKQSWTTFENSVYDWCWNLTTE